MKTLKDLENSDLKNAISNVEQITKTQHAVVIDFINNSVYVPELRVAAIEEIKEITRVGFIDDPDDAIDNECNDRLVAWIKHFFNLTGEDLK